MKRGAIKKSESKLLTVWIPGSLETHLQRGAAKEDSDKSKFVRIAIREKLARHGINVEMEAA
jgi:hypothetical protein